jgi:spore germination protein YaaH
MMLMKENTCRNGKRRSEVFFNRLKITTLINGFCLFLILVLFAPSLSAQSVKDLRKNIYGAKRKLRTEINRTKRDFRGINKALSSNKRTVDTAVDTTDMIEWSMKPYIPNSGMIHDYEHVFSFLHAKQEYTFSRDADLKSIAYDSVDNVFYKNIGSDYKLDDDVEVMGWHPHWMEDAYKSYNYKLLSIISYYSYDINPHTGSYWNPEIIDQLRNSSLPDSAAKYGTKTFISVTSLEKENNKIFLTNEMAKEQFIYEIIELLGEKEGKFSGIDLNFEEIDIANRDDFTHFIKELSVRLSNEGYSLILDVPYFNHDNVLDYNELKNHVMYFNIMGYDFSGENATYPGSISPLQALDTQPSLETSVNDFLNLGVSGQQIIMSLPLYGVTWDITNLEKGNISFFERSVPYYKIISNYNTEYHPYYDAFSSSFFYVINENGTKKMCWFENEISLDIKFQWAKGKNLKGIGLWALGYAQGAPEIWKSVADNYGADSLVVITPVETTLSGTYGIVKDIVRYKKVIGVGFLVFAGFIILGLVISLKDWRVREILFQKQSFRVIYTLLFVTLMILGVEWWWLNDTHWDLVIGLVIGAACVILINIIFSKYRKQLR